MRIKLDIPLSVYEIASFCDGSFLSQNIIIDHIVTDSREVENGDLFFYLGKDKDLERIYVNEALQKGGITVSTYYGENVLSVKSPCDALLSLAKRYVELLPNLRYKIAVTGSIGKTTTKEILNKILSSKYISHSTNGNYNNHIGVPLTLLSAPKETEILVVEMGMNHSGEIQKLSECLAPDLGIITNIGSSHIGNLGSREAIAKAKSEIICGMEKPIVIVPLEENLLAEIPGKISFSTKDSNANFYIKKQESNRVKIYQNGILFCDTNFYPTAPYLLNCLAPAVATATICTMNSEEIKYLISNITDDISRQKLINIGNLYFYEDFYNASYESILSSFESIKCLNHKGSKSLLLGDIGELGEYSDSIHFAVGKSIPKELFSNLYFFGNQADNLRCGALRGGYSDTQIFTNTDISRPEITTMQIKSTAENGELVLMKASRFMKLERILDYFQSKE